MLFLYYLFVILHIITAASWFGLGLRLAGQARRTLAAEAEAARILLDDGGRTVYLMNIMIVLTIAFSYAAFFLGGGFGGNPPSFHIALTLIIVLAAIQFLMIHSGWNGLRRGIESNEPQFADSSRKKVAIGTGIGHTLWLILLILMFWPEISVML